MFRMLVLQALNNLSDEQVEYHVRDRLSFSRFLGLAIEDSIPDATTLWLFREKLVKAEMTEKLFDRFDQHLAAKGYMARGGQIIDASIVLVPTQRNSRDENAELQAGRTPAGWKQKPAKVRQKDRDARWTKKHGRSLRSATPRCGCRRSVACASPRRSHPASNPVGPACASRGEMLPPLGLGAILPVSCCRCIHLMAELGPHCEPFRGLASRCAGRDGLHYLLAQLQRTWFRHRSASKNRISAARFSHSNHPGKYRFNPGEICSKTEVVIMRNASTTQTNAGTPE